MIVVPLPSWAGTPDVTADRKCEIPPVPVSAYAETSEFVDTSHTPQQDTSLVHPRDKKTRFGAPSLKMVSPLAMTSPKRGLILKRAVIFILLTCVAGAVLIYLLWLYSSNPSTDRGFCNSTDCDDYEALIDTLLNRSVDPCDDFSAFVCSAWKSLSSHNHWSRSSREDVVDAWSKNFEVVLRKGKKYLEVGEKPLTMLNLCQYSSTYDATSSVELLQRFMEERKIRWPGQPQQDVDPLEVLLDLDINWGMAVWIHVEFLRKQGASGQRALRVSSAGRIREWLSRCQQLVSAGSFYEYWRKHYMLFATSGAPTPTHQQGNRTAQVQIAVLQQLLEASRNNTAIQFLLKDLQSRTPRIPSERWIATLNAKMNVYPAFTGDDCIIASQPVLLTALNKITSAFHHDDIMENIAWSFVQMIAPVVDVSILSLFPRQSNLSPDSDAEVTAALLFAFCSWEVESAYRLLVTSLNTIANFPLEVRQEIDTRLTDIRHAAVDKIDAIEWLMPQWKRRAQGKLNASRILLWPSEELLSSTALSFMYRGFPTSDLNIIKLWLRVRMSVHQLALEYEEVVHMPANLVLPLVDYDYLLNSVHISTQTLSPPVYYKQGTHAMFYGGLGFLYASQLVRALDAEGLRIDAEGDIVDELWLSPLWRHAVMDVAACLSGGGSYFPEIPALEVTYKALETALSREGGQRLRIGFSERQLFFITICFLTCSQPGTEPPADCNKAMMNFPPFANAFGCRNSSKMKPARQCSFFSQQI
ncbi:neprilysin [Rhipicephalus microplus]|uniref:neprilysin n=1 Tax=Rhipicephalus microplus TaxID=6941 RepID=UPI003F6B9B6E